MAWKEWRGYKWLSDSAGGEDASMKERSAAHRPRPPPAGRRLGCCFRQSCDNISCFQSLHRRWDEYDGEEPQPEADWGESTENTFNGVTAEWSWTEWGETALQPLFVLYWNADHKRRLQQVSFKPLPDVVWNPFGRMLQQDDSSHVAHIAATFTNSIYLLIHL